MKIAGIEVHKKVLMVVVIDATTPEEKPEQRRFTTLPSELHRLSSWLRAQDVQEAVMESTAQYWRSVWLELEPHMLLHLAHAFSNRAPRGRKHDFRDAERLVRRLIADELILSFVPNGEQRIWRNLTRMKTQLTRDRVRLQSQMECLLEEMRIKLSSVVSDLLGASGLRILRALAAGETEPEARFRMANTCYTPKAERCMITTIAGNGLRPGGLRDLRKSQIAHCRRCTPRLRTSASSVVETCECREAADSL